MTKQYFKTFRSKGVCHKFDGGLDSRCTAEAHANYWIYKHDIKVSEIDFGRDESGFIDNVTVVFECDDSRVKFIELKADETHSRKDISYKSSEIIYELGSDEIIASGWSDDNTIFILYLVDEEF